MNDTGIIKGFYADIYNILQGSQRGLKGFDNEFYRDSNGNLKNSKMIQPGVQTRLLLVLVG